MVLPSGILTDDSTKEFAQDLLHQQQLASFFDFDNRQGLFPTVQGNVKFCLLTLSIAPSTTFNAAAQLGHPSDLRDESNCYTLTLKDIVNINPNTLNCPTFAKAADALLVRHIHTLFPIITRAVPPTNNPWNISFKQGLFNMTTDSHLFLPREDLERDGWCLDGNIFTRNGIVALPLYEAKLTSQYNHRAATFQDVSANNRFRTHAGTNESTADHLRDATYYVIPRYWVQTTHIRQVCPKNTGWFIGFRNAISAVADSRSLVATIIPYAGVGNSMPLLLFDVAVGNPTSIVAALNSFILDYILRQKASGGNLNFYVFKQLPISSSSSFAIECAWNLTTLLSRWISEYVLELTYAAWDLEPFAQDCGWNGPPFRWDEERRFLLRCELDAAFFHLYLAGDENGEWRVAKKEEGCPCDETPEQLAELKKHFPTPRHAVDYIMDTFPIVKRRDEATHGYYRTKDTILDIYDAMQRAIASGQSYQTMLEPAPGPPCDAQGNFISMYQLDRDNWPLHIHPPHPDWEESLLSAWFDVCQKRWQYLEVDQTFPWDGREAFTYVLIPYLAKERPGEKFEFYRDAAMLASHQDRCETLLLDNTQRTEYRQAVDKIDWLKFPDTHRIRPCAIRDSLQNKRIIQTDAKTGATTLVDEHRLPPLPTELNLLLPLILKAADTLDRHQRRALEDAEAATLSLTCDDITAEFATLIVA